MRFEFDEDRTKNWYEITVNAGVGMDAVIRWCQYNQSPYRVQILPVQPGITEKDVKFQIKFEDSEDAMIFFLSWFGNKE